MSAGWALVPVVLIGFLGLLLVWGYLSLRSPAIEPARRQFQQQREHLEARFFQLASSSGKPRGLRWKDCEWGDQVAFARDRSTGQLAALAGITVSFEAIEGSDMEGLPAVGNLRNASAVFFYDQGRWLTTGRTIFNLSPDEVIRHFAQQYEHVENEQNV